MKRADHDTIQQVLDGSISRAGFADFQQRMRDDPAFSKLYGDYALLHHTLCEEFGDHPVPAELAALEKPVVSTCVSCFVAAAVLVVLGVIAYKINRQPKPGASQIAAEMEFSEDAVWHVDGARHRLELGATLELFHGRARFSPGKASSALIDGPARLTYVSQESLHLADGRGRFLLDAQAGKLEVTTRSFSAVDLGTEFGVESHASHPDEMHVIDGKILVRINGRTESETLSTGQAARIAGVDQLEHFAADPERFPRDLGVFKPILGGAFVKQDWRVGYGAPTISADRIQGENFAVFCRLATPAPDAESPVLLATFPVDHGAGGEFHTDGWAGLSFFSKGTEVVFFGDSFGPERTWSLDVKQRSPVILPGNPVVGPRSVTMRYDRRTGDVSLHDGGGPLGAPFCEGMIPKELTFDEVRIGASSNAAVTAGPISIRAGGR